MQQYKIREVNGRPLPDTAEPGKRKRDSNDAGPVPEGYAQAVATGRTPPRIPTSEGGASDAKKTNVPINTNDSKLPTKEEVLQLVSEAKDDLANYLEKVLPPELNQPIKQEERREGDPDVAVEWDPEDNYTTRLKKVSPTNFIKHFQNPQVRIAMSLSQYQIIVDSMLNKMNITTEQLGDPDRTFVIKKNVEAFIKILGGLASKLSKVDPS